MPEKRFTVKEVAGAFEISDKRVYKLIKDGRIKHLWEEGRLWILGERDGGVMIADPPPR